MTKEGKLNLKERFIDLRAEGRSYADIAEKLEVSKPTLIAWGHELEKEVANARTLHFDALFERYAVGKAKRIEVFGKRLEAILKELDTRDLKDIPTSYLLTLALKYGEHLAAEAEPLELQGEQQTVDVLADKLFKQTRETWNI